MFTDLPDDDLMLLLCERPDNHPDPAAWCASLRELVGRPAPATADEADKLKRDWDELRQA